MPDAPELRAKVTFTGSIGLDGHQPTAPCLVRTAKHLRHISAVGVGRVVKDGHRRRPQIVDREPGQRLTLFPVGERHPKGAGFAGVVSGWVALGVIIGTPAAPAISASGMALKLEFDPISAATANSTASKVGRAAKVLESRSKPIRTSTGSALGARPQAATRRHAQTAHRNRMASLFDL